MRKGELFDETVVSLYDAATDVQKWPVFLERMALLFEAPVCQVIYYDFEHEELTFNAHRGLDGFPLEMHQRYEELAPMSEHVMEMVRLPGKPLITSMFMDRETYESTPIYREVNGPSGVGGYGCGLAVHLEPSTFVGVTRRNEGPHFNEDDCMLLGRLVPHLKRALALHRRLATLETERDDALSNVTRFHQFILERDYAGALASISSYPHELLDTTTAQIPRAMLVGDALY